MTPRRLALASLLGLAACSLSTQGNDFSSSATSAASGASSASATGSASGASEAASSSAGSSGSSVGSGGAGGVGGDAGGAGGAGAGGAGPVCSTGADWEVVFGNPGLDYVADVGVDSAGNVVLVGRFAGTVSIAGGAALTSKGNEDVLVAKVTPGGAHIWSKSYGGSGPDRAFTVEVSPADKIVVTGWMEQTVDFGGGDLTSPKAKSTFILQLESDGSYVDADLVSASVEEGISATSFDKSGNEVDAGEFKGTLNLYGQMLMSDGGDSFVMKRDPAGALVWAKALSGSGNQELAWVAVDAGGDVLVTGPLFGTMNFGDGKSVTSAGGSDVYVAKLSGANGQAIWVKRFGDNGNVQEGNRVVADASGNVIVAGIFQSKITFGVDTLTAEGQDDIFVAKLDGATGDPLWAKAFGGNGLDRVRGLDVDPSGAIYIAGSFQETVDFGGGGLTSAGGDDIYFLKLTPSGAHACSQRFGGTADDVADGLEAHTNGAAAIGGEFSGTVDFGFGPHSTPSAGDRDGFVLQIAP
jgi:hypothetical protein